MLPPFLSLHSPHLDVAIYMGGCQRVCMMKSFSLSRETAAEILNRAGVEEKARGETLSPKRLAALSDILCEYAK